MSEHIDHADAVDRHVVFALDEAMKLGMGRDDAEYYIKNRLVTLSDRFTTPESLEAERSRRVMGSRQMRDA